MEILATNVSNGLADPMRLIDLDWKYVFMSQSWIRPICTRQHTAGTMSFGIQIGLQRNVLGEENNDCSACEVNRGVADYQLHCSLGCLSSSSGVNGVVPLECRLDSQFAVCKSRATDSVNSRVVFCTTCGRPATSVLAHKALLPRPSSACVELYVSLSNTIQTPRSIS